MNQITQHIPTFVDYREAHPQAEFITLAELEAVPFVAKWKDRPHFLRFSKSRNALMAEFSPSDEKPSGSYWVVGFLGDPTSVDIPEWIETEAQRLDREAWNRGERIT